jgi:hypothetical protein
MVVNKKWTFTIYATFLSIAKKLRNQNWAVQRDKFVTYLIWFCALTFPKNDNLMVGLWWELCHKNMSLTKFEISNKCYYLVTNAYITLVYYVLFTLHGFKIYWRLQIIILLLNLVTLLNCILRKNKID